MLSTKSFTMALAITFGVTLAAAANAQGSAVLYGGASNSLYTIDAATGIATLVGPTGASDLDGLAFVGDGRLVGSATDDSVLACGALNECSTLVEIDPASGAATFIGIIGDTGDTGECGAVSDLTFDPTTRTLYGLGIECEDTANSKLLIIDPDTGAGTIVGSDTGVAGTPGGLAREPSSGTFFMTSAEDLYTVDPLTGTAALVPPGNGITAGTVNALAFDPLTGVLFGSNDRIGPVAFLVTIDTATGADTDVGSSQDELTALAFQGPGGCPDAPLGSCTDAQKANLQLKTKDGKLKLDLKKLAATNLTEFGTPTTVTGYAVCLYDSDGGDPTLAGGYSVPAGAGWTAQKKGFRFKGNAGGITAVKLTEGDTGKAKVSVKGKVVDIPDLPLSSNDAVGQVVNDLGSCFGATVTATKANDNDPERYTARSLRRGRRRQRRPRPRPRRPRRLRPRRPHRLRPRRPRRLRPRRPHRLRRRRPHRLRPRRPHRLRPRRPRRLRPRRPHRLRPRRLRPRRPRRLRPRRLSLIDFVHVDHVDFVHVDHVDCR